MATNWREKAACRKSPTSLFFPAEWEKPAERKWREQQAKAICARCEVKDDCLEAGTEEEGIWGGLNESERRIRRRRARLQRPVVKTTEDENPWVRIDGDGPVQIWQRESDRTWHGVEWAIAKEGSVAEVVESLDVAYMRFHSYRTSLPSGAWVSGPYPPADSAPTPPHEGETDGDS